MKRLFSGMQPTGALHLGNYVGALKNWIALAESGTYDCIFCIVDYHAITIPYDTEMMEKRVFEAALDYLSAGLDPEKCSIFVQSQVIEHLELSWIFASLTPLGQLMRMTQFKQKTLQWSEKDQDEDEPNWGEEIGGDRDSFLSRAGGINSGLFTYPVLQAADILAYKGEVVPVGEDQVQHVELTRDIARRFNNRYGNVFPSVESLLSHTPRMMGLDADQKMSKSIGNHLELSEGPESILHKVTRESVSDARRQRRKDPGVPEECNLYAWHKIFSTEEDVAWAAEGCRTADIGCFECKKRVAERINAILDPIREKRQELAAHPDTIYDILNQGAMRCRGIARETLDETRAAMGLKKLAPFK